MFHSDIKWIWMNKQEEQDEYVSFLEHYESDGGNLILKIASEINYIAYVNGIRVAFGQFPGYLNEKYVDEVDITDFSFLGRNELRIVVRYEGIDSLNHIKDRAGVIFEVCSGDQVLCGSGEKTLGGLDTEYQQHVCRIVTWQLGYSVNMCYGDAIVYHPCREAQLPYVFQKRPVKKLQEEPAVYGRRIDIPGKEIYDFGREIAGYISLKIKCRRDCDIVLAYGEHITDGRVRQYIGTRDFSMHFHCKEGDNSFEQLFLRIGGRYVEILGPSDAKVQSVSVLPVLYPVEETGRFLTGLEEQIYDVSVRTLRLCMHEHYEDCPWREQALYVLDSRNQMLAGYYAFQDYSFARANIVFMSKGTREDGLLEMCYPAVNTPAIPFFTLMYPVAVWEYIIYTKDQSILDEVMPVVRGIMERFCSLLMENHLLGNLPSPYWNFYEWSEGSDGTTSDGHLNVNCDSSQHDLLLNCAFVYASERYIELCQLCGESFEVDLASVRNAVRNQFYDEERGMYYLSDVGPKLYGQLGNAFASLIGLEGSRLRQAVRGEENVIPATLSMMAFVYDALLVDMEENRQFILDDIKKNYSYMLERGATSFWETIKGEADFQNAGSLCHGWSAMPIFYYHKLLKE